MHADGPAEQWIEGTAAAGLSSKSQRPLRVCYLIDQLRTGGTETQLLMLIDHLDRTRIEPRLCLLDGRDVASQDLEPKSCPVERLEIRSLLRMKTIVQARHFARLLRDWKTDVLQVQFPDSTYFGVAAARLAGVKVIVRTRRDLFYWVTPMHRRWGRFIDGFYNRCFVTAMVTNSQAVREQTIRDESPPPKRIEVIPNGLDLERFVLRRRSECDPGRLDQPVRVGIVAMLRPEKRVDLFMQAAGLVVAAHQNVRFEIAGEGDERPSLEALIRQLGLSNHLQLRGRIADVPSFLSQMDIGVLCSDTEGSSNALIELMASGMPVVATAVGGNLELVDPEKNGLLIPVGDSRALADALLDLIRSPRKSEQMGARGRRDVQHRFAINTVADQYTRFYESLASNA